MSTTIQKTLETMAKMLDRVVGVAKVQTMTLSEFATYATGQIAKAATEPPQVAAARLKALQHAVSVVKDNYIDTEVDSLKVPITWPDTTSLKEKQNQLVDALANAKPGATESAFSQGFVAKLAEAKALVDSLTKAVEGEGAAEDEDEESPDDDEETKAKKAASRKAKADAATASQGGGGDIEDEDEEKRKKAAAKDGGGAADPDSDEGKAAKAKAPPFGGAKAPPFGKKPPTPPAPPGKEDADKTKKGLGVEWPADMADPDFVEHGTITKSLAWGRDGTAAPKE